MPYLIIENFANGLDLRKSRDTAPPGSLRTLRNAFINEGGEVEKAKSFARHAALTAYGQTANYKGRISGPCLIGTTGELERHLFRHRHNSLPSSGWTAGGGGISAYRDIGESRIYAMKSLVSDTNFGALMRSNASFSIAGVLHVIESYAPTAPTVRDHIHVEITTSSDGEPLTETEITDNRNRKFAILLNSKAYFANYSTVDISAVGDAGDMAGTGSGVLDTRTQSGNIGHIRGFGDYYGQLAVMAKHGCQFWSVDPDPDQNQYLRTIPLSCLSPRGIIGYGDGDVVYLGRDGVRSLRARDSSNVASVVDMGSPIDRLIRQTLTDNGNLTETTDGSSRKFRSFYETFPMAIHPETGHLWVCLGETIYVFSHYPGAGVKAWATFDMPTPVPANVSAQQGTLKSRWCGDICRFGDDIMLRNFADEVYLYGGEDGSVYDTTECEIITPHMDMGQPGLDKYFTGIDVSCDGTWTVKVSLDPTNVVWEEIATVTNSTFRLTGKIPMAVTGSHIAIRLTSTTASAARVGQVIIYYEGGDEK